MKPQRGKYVYVMDGGSESKIGVSIDPERRLRVLRPDGALRLERTWFRKRDARQVEAAAIAIVLNGECVSGCRTEWFQIPVSEAVKAVEQAIEIIDGGGRRPKRKRWVPLYLDPDKMKRLIAEYNEAMGYKP
jgi:hypothetical protein